MYNLSVASFIILIITEFIFPIPMVTMTLIKAIVLINNYF